MFFKSSRQGQFELLQKDTLVGIRCLYASQSDLCTVAGRQNHISQFELGKFPQDLPWLVSQACLTAQSPQSFPKDIGEKANQNMRLNTLVFLMPYWADTKIALVYPESILRLRQMNVCFP